MPDLSLASHIAKSLYGLNVYSVESLDQYPNDWRSMYRIHDSDSNQWLLRLMRLPEGFDRLTEMAKILNWLALKHFLAPTIRSTVNRQQIGINMGWATIILDYIDGNVLERNAADLGRVARLLGELHALDANNIFTKSRCHPDHIGIVIQQLAKYGTRVPHEFRTLVTDLHTAMVRLQRNVHRNRTLTHGDCWYANAIKTQENYVVLIDWDLAGVGSPLLELGNLLLTSHIDFSQPLHLEADTTTIMEIMRGYQDQRKLSHQQQESLADSMRYLLAFQLGSYVADDALVMHPEFPFVLRKLQARYQVTREIADIATRFISG